MAASDYLEKKLVDYILVGTAFPSPNATLHISLHTADPTDAMTVGEVTAGDYARQTVAFAGNAPSTDGTLANDATVSFVATSNWGTITHCGIFDALTVGNGLYHGALTTSKAVDNDTLRFLTDALVIGHT